jgi:hypothetical protein
MARIRNILLEMFGKKNIDGVHKDKTISDVWGCILEKAFSQTIGAANHLKVIGLSGNVLTIEADHTGWIQILQAQKNKILDIVREDFTGVLVEDVKVVLRK